MGHYRVLWIDDEYQQLTAFSKLALLNDIVLVPFQSTEEGMAYLAANMNTINAVLLDAMAFQKKGQEEGTESRKALYEAWEQITALGSAHQKPLPRFVLTGQLSLLRDTGFQEQYEGFFRKGSSEENQRLFGAIKQAIDDLPQAQLRHRYAPAFAACTPDVVSEKAGRMLLEVLQAIDNPQTNHQDDTKFNTLRIIIDEVFAAAIRHQLLPAQCVSRGEINQRNCSDILSGKPKKVSDTEVATPATTLLPAILATAVNTCLDLTSTASHGDRVNTTSALAGLRQTVRTPYLLVALTHQIMDLLVWFNTLRLDTDRLARHQGAWTISAARPR